MKIFQVEGRKKLVERETEREITGFNREITREFCHFVWDEGVLEAILIIDNLLARGEKEAIFFGER